MRIAAVVLGLAVSTAAAAEPAPILGGTPATKGEFPQVVALSIGGGLCTGTLVTPEWVVTAAHCVEPSVVGQPNQQALTNAMTVIFDSTVAAGGKEIGAQLTIPHPMYRINPPGLEWDVGLVHLKQPVTDRMSVLLNRNAADAPPGIHLEMVGYGVNQSGTSNAGVEYVLADKATVSCTNAPETASDVNLLCWDQRNLTGKCEGDSGGPSFAKIGGVTKQVGLTSVGWDTSTDPQKPNCDVFGADTRVDHVIAWMDSVIGPALRCTNDGACTNTGCGLNGNPADSDCPTCSTDGDCKGTDQTCDHGVCVTNPLSPGGLGSTCTTDTDCTSGVCAASGTDKKCIDYCTVGDASGCPAGFDCLDTGGGKGACWPGAAGGGGGCCSTGGDGAAPTFLLAGLVALGVARRRRR